MASDFDVPGFVNETKLLARVLGACIVDDAGLQKRIVDLLEVQDRENRIARSSDLRCVLVEALLFHKREERKVKFLVGEVTDTVNNLFRLRDEHTTVTERKVGEELKRMGFRKRRQGPGIYLVLDTENQQRIERLAKQYKVLASQLAGAHPPDKDGLASA